MLSLQIFISNMSGITTTYNFTGQESGLKSFFFFFFGGGGGWKEECITKVHYQVIRFFPFLYLLMASPSSVEDFSFLIVYLHTWNQSWDSDTIKNVCDKRSKKQHSHLQAQSQNMYNTGTPNRKHIPWCLSQPSHICMIRAVEVELSHCVSEYQNSLAQGNHH